MEDPYVYPGTDILINKEGIRDRDELEVFERMATANRMETIPANLPLTIRGYHGLHRHIFQDVYPLAGKPRTIDIAKGNSLFCRAPLIASQMAQRFAAIRADARLKAADHETWTVSAGEQICEVNTIHPFREGNGRIQRAFLEYLGAAAGFLVRLEQIDPRSWQSASIVSFQKADYGPMHQLIREISAPS